MSFLDRLAVVIVLIGTVAIAAVIVATFGTLIYAAFNAAVEELGLTTAAIGLGFVVFALLFVWAGNRLRS